MQAEGQPLDVLGEDVDDAVGAFEHAPDEQPTGLASHPAVPGPHGGLADDVDHARLVLEVEERDAPGGGRPLPVGDDPAHGDPGAIAESAQPRGGDDAQLVQTVADQRGGVAVGSDAGGPHVGDQLLGLGHGGQRGRVRLVEGGQVELAGAGRGRCPRGPQRVAPVGAEAVERPGRGERLDLIGGEPDASRQVGHRSKRRARVAFGHDALGQFGADGADAAQSHPHRRLGDVQARALRRAVAGFQGRRRRRDVEVGLAGLDAVPLGVMHQRLR